jgi:ppGpp synthetase/RelA/SpoT-type nucleotidyltranferase
MSGKKEEYVVDLRKVEGDGILRCPKCGNIISPDDETEKTYRIVKTKIKGDNLSELTLACNKCKSVIRLLGLDNESQSAREDKELKEQYENLYPLYKRLCEEVVFILKDEIQKSRIKIHGISHRLKTFDSFYKKIIKKQISPEVFRGVHDIAGVRIVCLYRSDLEKIGELIARSFEIISLDTSRTRSEAQFGYMADHYVVKLGKECKGKRYDDILTLECEIQVRTVLMDAWASVSHHLDYKKETDIPSTLRKDFNAVSGLLYAADTHFELFKEGIEKSKEQLMKSVRSDKLDMGQEINMDSLAAYLKWRLPDRERYSVSTYSDLVTDLNKLSYVTIGEVDQAIRLTEKEVNALEKEEMHRKFYSDTGFVRICLMLYDNRYYEAMRKTHLEKNEKFFELVERARSKIKRGK